MAGRTKDGETEGRTEVRTDGPTNRRIDGTMDVLIRMIELFKIYIYSLTTLGLGIGIPNITEWPPMFLIFVSS